MGAAQLERNALNERITRVLTRFVRGFSAHWLAMANLAVALYWGLPMLAPTLMHAGHEGAAGLLYALFRPLCHQKPERTFFLFGEQFVYGLERLEQVTGGFVSRKFLGNLELGWKMAVCERCFAIYATMLTAGLLFGLLRSRCKPLSFRGFAALLVPMGIDGFGQLIGLWSSTWVTRLVTGGLFGLACIWVAYPHLERAMREVYIDVNHTIESWELDDGR